MQLMLDSVVNIEKASAIYDILLCNAGPLFLLDYSLLSQILSSNHF